MLLLAQLAMLSLGLRQIRVGHSQHQPEHPRMMRPLPLRQALRREQPGLRQHLSGQHHLQKGPARLLSAFAHLRRRLQAGRLCQVARHLQERRPVGQHQSAGRLLPMVLIRMHLCSAQAGHRQKLHHCQPHHMLKRQLRDATLLQREVPLHQLVMKHLPCTAQADHPRHRLQAGCPLMLRCAVVSRVPLQLHSGGQRRHHSEGGHRCPVAASRQSSVPQLQLHSDGQRQHHLEGGHLWPVVASPRPSIAQADPFRHQHRRKQMPKGPSVATLGPLNVLPERRPHPELQVIRMQPRHVLPERRRLGPGSSLLHQPNQVNVDHPSTTILCHRGPQPPQPPQGALRHHRPENRRHHAWRCGQQRRRVKQRSLALASKDAPQVTRSGVHTNRLRSSVIRIDRRIMDAPKKLRRTSRK